jgi:hypothetical protein
MNISDRLLEAWVAKQFCEKQLDYLNKEYDAIYSKEKNNGARPSDLLYLSTVHDTKCSTFNDMLLEIESIIQEELNNDNRKNGSSTICN